MGNQLDGRINRLEQLRGVNGGKPKIIVCWCGVGKPCTCQDDANENDIIIRVVYRDRDPDTLD